MTYEEALAEVATVGAVQQSDAALMASYCDGPMQLMVGAASPKLVWEGAQKKGLSAHDLVILGQTDPLAVHELMWI
ncbi:hypothetical protein CDO52_12800 [Nocardiopsis gilva YIM 90087]|uniref:Uncharacterized protein n=1 Tax=Nocardiopsis gilva YIM 90087 TaxID=1235441 RepID=A0A223S621_9ACTN|nr:hypothetical protein [Nocardiopsis gilva]ASU83548.1 hypothetical protein CDO52_12800 [Nocardiopsis gilva YIM 90087]